MTDTAEQNIIQKNDGQDEDIGHFPQSTCIYQTTQQINRIRSNLFF